MLSYDLHIHSCLSPCGDNDMTPPNIVNMAAIKGLEVIAITDHNSTRNVRAAVEAARELPLVVVPGMEVSVAEEFHMVCLFPDCDSAEAAGLAIEDLLPPLDNDPGIFGDQLIMGPCEEPRGEVSTLLINATSLSVDRLPQFVAGFGGICYPAHIDRSSFSILATFGMLPEVPAFHRLEVAHPDVFFADPARDFYRRDYQIITSSDAHRLGDIAEPQRFLDPNQWPMLTPLLREKGLI